MSSDAFIEITPEIFAAKCCIRAAKATEDALAGLAVVGICADISPHSIGGCVSRGPTRDRWRWGLYE